MDVEEIPLSAVVARLTGGEPDPATVIQRVLDLAILSIGPADGASLTIYDGEGKPFTSAASDTWVIDIDRLQYDTLQGPCLEVATTSAPAAGTSDTAHSESWPVFGPVAHDLGVRAVLAAGLTGRPDPANASQPPGALNLYARGESPFSAEDRERAVLLAAMAGIATCLAEQRATARRLREAMSNRDIIGQAKGILMERHGISAEEAFSTLRRASNHLNIKLRDIAVRVISRQNGNGTAVLDPKTRLPRL